MGFVHHKRSVSPPYLIFHVNPSYMLQPSRFIGTPTREPCEWETGVLPWQTQPSPAGPLHFQLPELPWSPPHCHLGPTAWTWLIILSVACSTSDYGFGEKQHHAVNAWALAAGEHETSSKEWISCLAHKTWQIQLVGSAWGLLTCAFVQAVYLKTLQKSNGVILN